MGSKRSSAGGIPRRARAFEPGCVRWTTDLGNALLAQQQAVMAAVQRLRMRAEANGKLRPGPHENVTTATQNGQSAIEIQPADPGTVYVPAYNPNPRIWRPA